VFIEWSNCLCLLDFVSYFSQPVKRRDEPGFFQPRGSLSPHQNSTSSARRQATATTLPPLLFLGQTLFSIPIVYYSICENDRACLNAFPSLLYFKHIQLTGTTPSFTSQRDLLESGSLVVVKLHYRKAYFHPIIVYRFAEPSSNLLSIKDTFATDRLATC
jgi:hypothetical protein